MSAVDNLTIPKSVAMAPPCCITIRQSVLPVFSFYVPSLCIGVSRTMGLVSLGPPPVFQIVDYWNCSLHTYSIAIADRAFLSKILIPGNPDRIKIPVLSHTRLQNVTHEACERGDQQKCSAGGEDVESLGQYARLHSMDFIWIQPSGRTMPVRTTGESLGGICMMLDPSACQNGIDTACAVQEPVAHGVRECAHTTTAHKGIKCLCSHQEARQKLENKVCDTKGCPKKECRIIVAFVLSCIALSVSAAPASNLSKILNREPGSQRKVMVDPVTRGFPRSERSQFLNQKLIVISWRLLAVPKDFWGTKKAGRLAAFMKKNTLAEVLAKNVVIPVEIGAE
ncbi:hypothetical protein C8J57DRAFT_1245861 [Mycena rebaudengoi]|nr:hypothetical protein C8J57DRAFT_1245861 [Mycena rebaudengoi]